MFAVQVTRVLRPVGVLLGGSGRARDPSRAARRRADEAHFVCVHAGDRGCREPRCGRGVMLTTLYRKRIAALAIQLAKDDPQVVKEVIARLRKSGEIEADDLVYLDEIADRWIRIAEENRQKARR
jgi:hypothetical protein